MTTKLLAGIALVAAAIAVPAYADQATHDWSGPYVGLSISGVAANSSFDVPDPSAQFTHHKRKRFDLDLDGVAPQVNAGYNFQSGNVVFGVEADTTVPVGKTNTW